MLTSLMPPPETYSGLDPAFAREAAAGLLRKFAATVSNCDTWPPNWAHDTLIAATHWLRRTPSKSSDNVRSWAAGWGTRIIRSSTCVALNTLFFWALGLLWCTYM